MTLHQRQRPTLTAYLCLIGLVILMMALYPFQSLLERLIECLERMGPTDATDRQGPLKS